MYLILGVFLALMPPPQTGVVHPSGETDNLIRGVERAFAQMKDLNADFVQVDQNALNRTTQASGHLYLMRTRKMRWEYARPEEELFVSDGKNVYFYVPGDRQVHVEAVKETFDERMPLMFLLGKSNLSNEFRQFELLNTKPFLEGTKVIRMYPKKKTDIKDVVIEVDPANYQIRRLLLDHTDGSHLEFTFSNIRTNTGLKGDLFDFKIPAGVAVVQGIGQ